MRKYHKLLAGPTYNTNYMKLNKALLAFDITIFCFEILQIICTPKDNKGSHFKIIPKFPPFES